MNALVTLFKETILAECPGMIKRNEMDSEYCCTIVRMMDCCVNLCRLIKRSVTPCRFVTSEAQDYSDSSLEISAMSFSILIFSDGKES